MAHTLPCGGANAWAKAGVDWAASRFSLPQNKKLTRRGDGRGTRAGRGARGGRRQLCGRKKGLCCVREVEMRGKRGRRRARAGRKGGTSPGRHTSAACAHHRRPGPCLHCTPRTCIVGVRVQRDGLGVMVGPPTRAGGRWLRVRRPSDASGDGVAPRLRPLSRPRPPPLTGRAVPTDCRADLASIWEKGEEGRGKEAREETRAPTRVKRARSLDTPLSSFTLPSERPPTACSSPRRPPWRPARDPLPPARRLTYAPARGSRRCKLRRTHW